MCGATDAGSVNLPGCCPPADSGLLISTRRQGGFDFGEPIEKTRTVNRSDLIITGGSQTALEGDFAYDNAEIQDALAERKLRLEKQKDKDMSRAASKQTPPKAAKNGFADLGF
jgi:hypothetical protein